MEKFNLFPTSSLNAVVFPEDRYMDPFFRIKREVNKCCPPKGSKCSSCQREEAMIYWFDVSLCQECFENSLAVARPVEVKVEVEKNSSKAKNWLLPVAITIMFLWQKTSFLIFP